MKLTAKLALLGSCSLLVFLAVSSVGLGTQPSATAPAVSVSADVGEFISVQAPSPIALGSGPIMGDNVSVSGNGSWVVKTNDTSGYDVTIAADQNGVPAMRQNAGSDSFADFSGPGAWAVGANASAFGWSADGSTYQGFNGTTALTLASSTAKTPDGGDSIPVYFEAGVGSGHIQSVGTYTANVTVTATGKL